MAITPDILGHYKLSSDSIRADYDAVAHLAPGTVFKVEESEYEQIMLNLQTWYPTFEARYIHPGTELYVLEGSGSLVVVTSAE